MRDLVIPIFDRLNETMESPPADSYVRVMDELQNSAFLTSAAVGDLLLPAVLSAATELTNFFAAIRAGIKDVNQLPEPIQDIVLGAKDLYEGLLEIARAIESSVGPEIRELLPALATLLGGVLELAGAIADVLSPAYEILSKVIAINVALITKLAQDITSLIGVLTDFVDWVSRAWREEERFAESTERVSKAIENVEEATKNATTSTQEYQNSLRTILIELDSVNNELENKKAKVGGTQRRRSYACRCFDGTNMYAELHCWRNALNLWPPASLTSSKHLKVSMSNLKQNKTSTKTSSKKA